MTPTQQIELEAAAFRRLISHLNVHSDVQNIDLMLTADFCRNCLAKWYLASAQEKQIELNEGKYHIGIAEVVRFVGKK
jgi:hypothetical protein